MIASVSKDKPSSARRFAGLLLAFAALVGSPLPAYADEVGPLEESCVNKAAGDTCADLAGAAGTCSSAKDPRGRGVLRCVAGAKAPAPQPSTQVASVAEKKSCAVSAAGSSNEEAPIGIAVAFAAFVVARAKRRARSAG